MSDYKVGDQVRIREDAPVYAQAHKAIRDDRLIGEVILVSNWGAPTVKWPTGRIAEIRHIFLELIRTTTVAETPTIATASVQVNLEIDIADTVSKAEDLVDRLIMNGFTDKQARKITAGILARVTNG